MLERNSDGANSLSNSALINANEILRDVKASYSALAKKDFDEDIELDSENKVATDNISDISNILEKSENAEESKVPETNCLALTVRKDYNLTILKNVVSKGRKFSLENSINYIYNKYFKYDILKPYLHCYKYGFIYSICEER